MPTPTAKDESVTTSATPNGDWSEISGPLYEFNCPVCGQEFELGDVAGHTTSCACGFYWTIEKEGEVVSALGTKEERSATGWWAK